MMIGDCQRLMVAGNFCRYLLAAKCGDEPDLLAFGGRQMQQTDTGTVCQMYGVGRRPGVHFAIGLPWGHALSTPFDAVFSALSGEIPKRPQRP